MLNLSKNNVSFDDISIFREFIENFENLDLDDNTLDCDCSLIDLLYGEDFTLDKINEVKSIICSDENITFIDFVQQNCITFNHFHLILVIIAIIVFIIFIILIMITYFVFIRKK